MTIFFAGHETSAMALTWAFHLIATHPEVESKLAGEIETVLDNRAPGFDDLPKLAYTRQVIEEALRLYPSAYLFAREPVTDQPLGGLTIPAGTMVFITPYVTQHDPAYWNDPERFDPERFNAENAPKINEDAYYPFGEGPHLCIGNNFALMEGQLALAMTLQRYRVQLVPGQTFRARPLVTLRPEQLLARLEAPA